MLRLLFIYLRISLDTLVTDHQGHLPSTHWHRLILHLLSFQEVSAGRVLSLTSDTGLPSLLRKGHGLQGPQSSHDPESPHWTWWLLRSLGPLFCFVLF